MRSKALTTPRRNPTDIERAQIFRDADGQCHICKIKIAPGESWDVEDLTPKALGGKSEMENWRPAHVHCHRGPGGKTSKDRQKISKADSIAVKHTGVARRRKRIEAMARELYGTDGFPTFKEALEEAERRV